ncbi:MAG: endo-1,4-beta-xylanase, partial [Bryocella sp.]
QSWDVVNEAIDPNDHLPGALRNTPWYKLLGPKYIDIAYRTARQADPHALLVYNDYGIEEDNEPSAQKRTAVLELLRGMQRRGVPIDALGIQSHLTASSPAGYGVGLAGLIADVERMGLKVFITELDVNDRRLPAAIPERDDAVAKTYAQYLKLVLAHKPVIAVLTWGITDKATWLNTKDFGRSDGLPERPLPFDPNLKPTPAFFAEVNALRSAPKR